MIRLPKDLLTQGYTKPKVYLCEVDKQKICQLETTNLHGTFKFNAYSEISFTVGRVYTNVVTGTTTLNPFYDKIEALRLIYLEGFGYFEIQEPELVGDGIQEVKNITAYSLEYSLSQKYIEGFNINTGENNSVEVVFARDEYKSITPVTLYNPNTPNLSLLHIALEKIYGWEIGHVDECLQTMSRTFEISRVSVYDFIMQDICDKFNCYVVFDTMATDDKGKKINKIHIYAEALVTTHIGDGETCQFKTNGAYKNIESVAIDSYKTTEYTHIYKPQKDNQDEESYIIFENPPEKDAVIEITDGSQLNWTTDVYISFQNLAQEVKISYSADDIKTVLTVKGADDLDISEVNMGLTYLTDISYYCSVDWMGQELYDAYLAYSKKCDANYTQYAKNSEEIIDLQNRLRHECNRISLQYERPEVAVGPSTVGTYFIKGTDELTGYDSYKEVTLPDEFNAHVVYYVLNHVGINEEKLRGLSAALRTYFMSDNQKDVSELEKIKDQFKFLKEYAIDDFIQDLSEAAELSDKNTIILNFLRPIWNEVGYNPLEQLYYKEYNSIKINGETDGWDDILNENYWQHYPVTLIVSSIEVAMAEKKAIIDQLNSEQEKLEQDNEEMLLATTIANNFTDEQQAKLSVFFREDEYTDDNFFITDYDTTGDIIRTKKELLQCGRIELKKLCEPKLSFSMDMANIYAMSAFEPIIHQFDLGKLVSIEIRPRTSESPAYVKQARLLQVDFNFEDFSDFSCEFGELTSLRTPSSIHADLLSTALSAGKSVASNASYWNKGVNTANSTVLKIQQGLLATNKLYTSDQSVVIDNDGIRLRKVNEDGSFSPYQAWIKNNTILLSSTGFAEGSVSELGLGEFTVDGETFYGILAKVIMSGYIEGSRIVGGTINIGDGAFMVHSDGTVVMNGHNTISGYATEEELTSIEKRTTIISSTPPVNANDGQLWLNTSIEPYELMVFTHGEWVYFTQQDDQKIYTSQPGEYSVGDLWILAEGEMYPQTNPIYGYGNILKANEKLEWVDATPSITNTISNIEQYFEFNKNSGLKIGQKDEKFYVNISSTRMSFYDKSNGEDAAEQKRDPDEVVYISNKSAVMKKLVVEDDAMFKSPTTFEQEINIVKADTTTGFVWKVEQNGSLSLAII